MRDQIHMRRNVRNLWFKPRRDELRDRPYVGRQPASLEGWALTIGYLVLGGTFFWLNLPAILLGSALVVLTIAFEIVARSHE